MVEKSSPKLFFFYEICKSAVMSDGKAKVFLLPFRYVSHFEIDEYLMGRFYSEKEAFEGKLVVNYMQIRLSSYLFNDLHFR